MAWYKREVDPIEERSRELQGELDRLKQQIKRLETRRSEPSARPAAPENRPIGKPAPRRPELRAGDPIFEEVNSQPAPPTDSDGAAASANLYNSTVVRKYDLPALLRRIRVAIFGGGEDNRKLINYLAVGSIHGLRPLRKERRVARRRALVAAGVFAGLSWWIAAMFFGSP
jgi:hypothetical protein